MRLRCLVTRMRRARRMSLSRRTTGADAARGRCRITVGDPADRMGRIHGPLRGDRYRGGSRPGRWVSRLHPFPRRCHRQTGRPAVRDRSATLRSRTRRGARRRCPRADTPGTRHDRFHSWRGAVRDQRHQPGRVRRPGAGAEGSRGGRDRRSRHRAHGGAERGVHAGPRTNRWPHLAEIRERGQRDLGRSGRIDAVDDDRGRRSDPVRVRCERVGLPEIQPDERLR